ncbi:unnamed protein product [Nezara viridula]|uniref:Uncharacterized protein n=1 Tax=Nezara viridula TaxID=85310 RepID=A0A9P0MPP3_NEZVI|nr:unnamed protein product [Nezara viridula]
MKVFLVTLLVVGLAAAAPCPKCIVKNLKAQLQQDVEDIETHTKQLIQDLSTHFKEDIAAFVNNPLTGSAALVKDLSKDARNVVLTTISDVNKVNEHIRTAINELKQFDAGPLKETLSNLIQNLVGASREARSNVYQLLKLTPSYVLDDVMALLSDPSGAPQVIKEHWYQHFNQFVSQGKLFAGTVKKEIQDALEKLNKQIE